MALGIKKSAGYGATATIAAPISPSLIPQKPPKCSPSSPAENTRESIMFEPSKELSTLDFFLTSLCLAGVQFTWTVELAYGSPYLLDLGLSKPLMSLVWLAGPLSGLLVAPIIGSYSDRLKSRFGRRRPFMIFGTLLVVASLFMVGFAKQWATHIVHYTSTAGSTDEDLRKSISFYAIILAVVGFYLLDFSINAVQATCRALILDRAPGSQQGLSNSWAGRMIGLGSVAGYFAGYLNLPACFPFFHYGQVAILCTVAAVVLVTTIAVTVFSVEEIPLNDNEIFDDGESKWYSTLISVFQAMCHLPAQVQRVCYVQFFAWLGWFPVLFYSTTWVTDVLARGEQTETPGTEFFDRATREGSLALLLFAVVSMVSSCLLPICVSKPNNGEARRLTITLPDIWAASHFTFAVLMLGTLFVGSSVRAAQALLAACGVCWAVAMWIPFALIGEEMMRERTSLSSMDAAHEIGNADAASTSPQYNYPSIDDDPLSEYLGSAESGTLIEDANVTLSSGMLLGIHNIYIVAPQFLTSLIAAGIFAALATSPRPSSPADDGIIPSPSPHFEEYDSVGWVLRIGGLSALIAAVITCRARWIL